MKQVADGRRMAKGAPSGFMVSLMVHGAILVAAVFITAFQLIREEPIGFVAKPVPERPPMKKKPIKVRTDKSAKPRATSVLTANVPHNRKVAFKVPDLPGAGDSLFDSTVPGEVSMALPDLPQTPIVDPDLVDAGNSLAVTYYNLNRRRDGTYRNIGYEEYFASLHDFVRSGWDVSKLNCYYRSPNRLHATTIMIPITPSTLGPAAFGEDLNEGFCWVVHYKGRIVHGEGLTFRFWGAADDVLTVRVGGEVVLAANFEWQGVGAHTIADHWSSSAPNNRVYRLANQKMVGGDWITLKPGVPMEMEAIAGEGPGGQFHAQLLVEVKGEDYPLNDRGAPIFPIFAMERPSRALQDSILENLFEGEANVTNVTTIFTDFKRRD